MQILERESQVVHAAARENEAREHAHRILDAVHRGKQSLASEAVADSWERCVKQHRLDPHQPCRPPLLDGHQLALHRARLAGLIDCARHEMATLFQQLGDAESAVVLSDIDGVILHMVTSAAFERDMQPLGLEVGAVWSEEEAGTNGMGTCAAAAAPVAVCLDDHFFSEHAALTCAAVPVYDPAGEMAAALDVTSRSPVPQGHLLVLLGMSARMIENRLVDLQFREAHQMHFHSRPEFVHTLHEGKLAVDGEGHVLAANRSALIQLGVASVRDLRGRRLDEIFQTTLAEMLERSMRASFHPVVTYRAQVAHRFFAVMRPPALGAVPASESSSAARPAARAFPGAGATPLPLTAHGEPNFSDVRMKTHLATAKRVCARGTPLLLHGETGAGKEVFARAVHAASSRAAGPFVAINCASLPESLIEAELFGYRAGAFTGAERRGRRGKIVQSNGGTLFLDEIGDMPLALQARLLRVLDDRTVTPLGTDDGQAVDFQLLSASHRNLPRLVAEGSFREDLFYRIAGIELDLPPLRERSDRAELIRCVLVQEGAADARLGAEAWDMLMQYRWPGNVRQLRHVLRSAVAMADGQTLMPEHLPALPRPASPSFPEQAAEQAVVTPPPVLAPGQAEERQTLLDLLSRHRWNVSQVAKDLGVSRNTLYRRLHKLHIPVTHAR